MLAQQSYFDHDAGAKQYRLGTHRTVSPEATLARVAPHLNEMGITRIANVTGLDDIGIPVVMVCRPNSRSISVAQGKGVDLALRLNDDQRRRLATKAKVLGWIPTAAQLGRTRGCPMKQEMGPWFTAGYPETAIAHSPLE